MPKKNFKDNPALQFISTAESGADTDEAGAADTEKHIDKMTPPTPKIPRAGFNGVEAKTQRIQLLMTPSLYRRVKNEAAKLGYSVNEFIHQTLDAATSNTSTKGE